MYGYIYKFTLVPTGKIYIGKKKGDYNAAKLNPKYAGKLFTSDYSNYSRSDVIVDILETAESEKELYAKLTYWINLFNSTDPTIGYNVSFKGENNPRYGKKLSNDTKEKISKANLGRKFSDEINKKKGRPGIKFSDDRNRKLSESLKGHLVSEETRKKISEANKGRKLSEEIKKKHPYLIGATPKDEDFLIPVIEEE